MDHNDKEKHRIDHEVQRTLASLNNIDDIETGPYFYTQLKTQVEALGKSGVSWPARLLLHGRLAPSLLALVVLLNILSVVVILSDTSDNQTELRQQYVEEVADEYLLSETVGWFDTAAE